MKIFRLKIIEVIWKGNFALIEIDCGKFSIFLFSKKGMLHLSRWS